MVSSKGERESVISLYKCGKTPSQIVALAKRDAGSSLYIDEPSPSNIQEDINRKNDTSDLDWSNIEDSTYSFDYESNEDSDSSKNDLGSCSTSVSTANPHGNLRKDAKEDREGEKHNVRVKTGISKLMQSGTTEADRRGKKSPPQKKSDEVKEIIGNHIKSLPVISSHYCRNTSKRKHIFTTEFNYGFHRPKKDQCDFCTKYTTFNEESKTTLQEDYDLHLLRKQESSYKERAKLNSDIACFTMDMEKILITPFLKVGKLYYSQKLKTFNFTIYNLANSEAVNYMWHEGIGKKGSSENATCLWKCLIELGSEIREVTFYSDTAAGQNRHCIDAAMFLRAVSLLPVEIINQTFLESEHSEVECDSVRSTIESRGSKVDVFTPESWYTVACTAKTKKPFYRVVELNKIKWLQYKKEDTTRIFFKERLSDTEFKSVVIKKTSTRRDVSCLSDAVSLPYSSSLSVEQKKFESLMRLCQSKCISKSYHQFYKNLKSTSETISPSSSDDE
ncbi:hypothetical protein ILUMI_20999 [Ignelater luminosus]|uniref:Uncharacterized protein n=1 Tax=Ignelater luminosus TaxID=2038154 RepID=A0A8K0CDB1_IGNLU|nr:hypothetical protein ILUMI_20999 [Ignelater luminosus]